MCFKQQQKQKTPKKKKSRIDGKSAQRKSGNYLSSNFKMERTSYSFIYNFR
jgi:hypothetical protein